MNRLSTWSRSLLIILMLAMLMMFIALMSGCGVRNVNRKTENSTVKAGEQSTSQGNVAKETSTSSEQTAAEKKDVVKEKQDTKVTEEFNTDGSIKKRVIETSNKKSVDNSSKQSKSILNVVNRIDSIFNNTNYRYVTITTHKVDLESERDSSWVKNLGGPLVIVILGLLTAWNVWQYFRKK